ncbi:MAG TPA: cold-shock protein [Thermoleophilia bacterium]|nr:cold-shock protein [Thermoleophilia bacterium]
MPQGKVKWFSAEKAFGFIEQDPDNDIFVHVTGLAPGVTTLEKDQLVEYETEQGRKGPQATNVRPVAAAPAAEEAAPAVEAAEAAEDEEVEVDIEIVEIVEVEEEMAPDAE